MQESEELEKDFSEVLGKLKNKELPKKEEDDFYKIIKTIIARKDESSKICIKVLNEIMPEQNFKSKKGNFQKASQACFLK